MFFPLCKNGLKYNLQVESSHFTSNLRSLQTLRFVVMNLQAAEETFQIKFQHAHITEFGEMVLYFPKLENGTCSGWKCFFSASLCTCEKQPWFFAFD